MSSPVVVTTLPENDEQSNQKNSSLTKSDADIAKKLESGGRIVTLIRKAESKNVSKSKTISFLKKRGISDSKIEESYAEYYKQEGLYEVTFTKRPLGFSVIMDTRGKNAIVSSSHNEVKAVKIASRIYEINGQRVEEMKYKDILTIISSQQLPFSVIFRKSKKKSKALEKLQKQHEIGWKNESDLTNKDNTKENDSDVDSDASYSSDDDEAIVANHYKRKKDTQKSRPSSRGLFKPNALENWDNNDVDKEQQEMLKELSRLMVNVVQNSTASNQNDDPSIGDMTHKRKATLRKLLNATPKYGSNGADNNGSQQMTFSENDLEEETQDYDEEIFKYMSDFLGTDSATGRQLSFTPSTSMLMRDFFKDTNEEDSSINVAEETLTDSIINPQDTITTIDSNDTNNQKQTETNNNNNNNNNDNNNNNNNNNNDTSTDPNNNDSNNNNNVDDEKLLDSDLINTLKSGTTMMKYGRYGKPKYKVFQLTSDHQFLVWYSEKKDVQETRIPIKEIQKILIASESKVVQKVKNKDLHETSFTILYGPSSTDEKSWKQLTVTAQNEKEAFVWAQGLKILSDATKKGTDVKDVKLDSSLADQHKHRKTQSVIISMDQVQRASIGNMFSKADPSSSIDSLKKQQSRLQEQLKKCAEFVMDKANYKAIKTAEQFDNVKDRIEDLENRLRDIGQLLESQTVIQDIAGIKADLFSVNADVDALKQKLTAIVRKPQKL